MPKPMCPHCQCFYRPKHNGFRVIEGKPDGDRGGKANDNLRGKRRPQAWTPYKIWVGDLWECPDCHNQIIVGFASQPLSEHYQPDFAAKATGIELQINDC